jgi:phosphate:Na+ symporter
VVAGANLGLIGTSSVIAWRHPRSRLPALANAVVKGTTALAVLIFTVFFGFLVVDVPSDPRVAAGIHLCIALATAALGLMVGPFLLARLEDSPLCRTGANPEEAGPRYLDIEVGGDMRLAMANSQREVLHASEHARDMLEQVWRAWSQGDRQIAKDAAQLDDRIDRLDRDIRDFLARTADDADPLLQREQLCQMRYLTQIEGIGDVIEKQLAGLVAKGARHAADMPVECRHLLDRTAQDVLRTMLTAETAFASRDPLLAQRLLTAKRELADVVRHESDRSLWRRRQGVPYEAEAIYLDLLSGLKRINSCACTVAYDILPASQAATDGNAASGNIHAA